MGSKLFTDRGYTLSESPAALAGIQYIPIRMDGEKTLTCSREGMVYVLTPSPDRNRDSVTEELLQQGFQKVALPEVRLFDRKNPGNYCTLYQKECGEGETVTFGKWALPVFFAE